ncbi:MAG: UDP-3-O-(3-hydroxymyristoyl)glucosamine N-acyltransferase, partial [Gammaproteobacteria bacterium]|nr:UDP-3-O-(3-hydroxymyristoyl)glucosamine N-acyltransferase [Gammaproteobacteria bacterium]
NPQYRRRLADVRAGAVILEERFRADSPVPCLVAPNPYATYARIAAYLHPPPAARPGIHPSAVVADDARIAPTAEIAAQAVVGSGSVIGDAAVVGPGSVVGEAVEIGAGTRLVARVVVLDRVRIGRRCILHPGAVIGADGFGFAPDFGGAEDGGWVKIPQLGTVVIGDDVDIGANTAIDRGAIEDTVIEDGVKLDNFVQIGHNVRVGAHTAMAGMTGVAGSAKIGKRCMIAGGVSILGHIEICDDAVLMFRSNVMRSIPEPGAWSGALPAQEASRWRRAAVRFAQLDELAGRVAGLERRIERPSGEDSPEELSPGRHSRGERLPGHRGAPDGARRRGRKKKDQE